MNTKKHLTTLAAIALLAISGVTTGTADATADTGPVPMAQPSSATGSAVEASAPASGVNFEPSEPAELVMTASQRNAVRTAEDYLDLSGFSRGGLIDQLEYEGFTPAQAAYGATAAGL